MKTSKDVPSYIQGFSKEIQMKLKELRKAVRSVAPKAEESISYGMPAYKFEGRPLAYFAAFKKHIGFYPTPEGTKAFAKHIAVYKHAKGSIQFPLDKKIPIALVKNIVKFKMRQIKEKKK